MKKYKSYKNENLDYKFRRNDYIRAIEVRVIDEEGEFVGVMTPSAALAIARERGLDLIEVAPQSKPPVCRIMDWSKFKFEFSKKSKGVKNTGTQLKEMWFKPMTAEGDLEYRIEKIRDFLDKKNRVKITIKPTRKASRLDKSHFFEQIKKVLSSLEEVADVETPPKVEGRNVYAIIKSKK